MQISRAQFFKTPWIWCTLIATLVIGGLSALAMAPTHYWPLLLLGIAFLYLIQHDSHKPYHAFFFGWLFGFGYFVIGLYWIGNALLVEGNNYKWAWPLAVSGLPAILAFYPALACYLTRKFFSRTLPLNFGAFLVLMMASEWLRGHLFTGFPWNLFGYAWGENLEMLQIIHFYNVYLLSGLTIFWGAALALPLIYPPRKMAVAVLALAVLSAGGTYIYGVNRLENGMPDKTGHAQTVTFKIVQPNIDQAEKWDLKHMYKHFQTLLELSMPDGQEKQTTFIVWPETAISHVILNKKSFSSMIADMLSAYEHDVYLITGTLLYDDRILTNSIIILNKQGEQIGQYDKTRLVPFGEYIPFREWIPIPTITNFSGFQKGNGLHTLPVTDTLSIAPLVCYEILFPSNIVEKNTSPSAIINVTNDAWYGISAGPYQHLLKARFRAIEEGLPVIRSANTGFSALIDPYGRYLFKTGLFEASVADADYTFQ